MTRLRLAGIALWMGAVFTLSASPILILDPVSGDLTGLAGSTVGWGFTITNDSNYIEFNLAEFCDAPVSLPGCNSPTTGVFNDFISAVNDVIIGPPSGTDPDSVTQVFDPVLETGIGSFQIDPLATGSDVGEIVLDYSIYDIDPYDPCNCAQFLGTGVLTAAASVTVAPEPCTAVLMAMAVVVFALRRLAWRKLIIRDRQAAF